MMKGGTEDPLTRMHRRYKEECIRRGTYKPFTQEEFDREVARWKAICNRQPVLPARKRKHPPKGTAD